MHILHCIPSMEGGGAERQLTYLAGELIQQGCAVDVALTRGGANLRRLEAVGARVHHLGPCGSHDPRLLLRLVRVIDTVKPDLVQCWLLQMEVLAGLTARMRGIPWLFSERSSAGAYARGAKSYLRWGAAALSNGIVANSTGGGDYWKGWLPDSVPRYVVRNALPLEEVARVPPADFQRELGLTGPVIVFAGRLDEGKNPETFVEALRHMREPASAVLCGDGPLRERIGRLVSQQGLSSRVRLVGFAPNLWSLLKSAAALVSPSRFEGSPNVVLEAMACGCPLVVSDIPAHRELLAADIAAFVDPEDPAALAKVLDAAVSDPAAARARAAGALVQVRRHALPAVAEQYIQVYREVLGRCTAAKAGVVT